MAGPSAVTLRIPYTFVFLRTAGQAAGTAGTKAAHRQGMNATDTTKGGDTMSGIPDVAKQWHVKPVGEKTCEQCQCDNVRAGVRHRLREDATGYWYEKIIKVCFGTDTSIEVIQPKRKG